MKAVVGITSLMVIFCFAIKAQDKENASKKGGIFTWEKKLVVADTARSMFKLYKGWPPKDDCLTTIPNAYSFNGVIYPMPIKTLSGEGLAPMPGTENLGRMKPSLLLDSIPQSKDKK